MPLRPSTQSAAHPESAARLAEQARDGSWSHEEYLAAVLSREVAAREASGATTRIRSAGRPTRKSSEDFNFDHPPALNRDMIAHLGTSAFLTKARNVVLGPPGTGKTHLAIGLAIRAAQAGSEDSDRLVAGSARNRPRTSRSGPDAAVRANATPRFAGIALYARFSPASRRCRSPGPDGPAW